MRDAVDRRRRLLLAAALSGMTAVDGLNASAHAQAKAARPSRAALRKLEPLRHVETEVLSIAYFEEGPAAGPAVILLHGFPYDIHTYADVCAMLAAKGYRTVVPYLRGYGETRFRDASTLRSGEQAALGADVIALIDALHIERAVFAGHNWGGRAATVAAALWPDRCAGLVTVNSYLIQDLSRAMTPSAPENEEAMWYEYYFQLERGRAGLAANRRRIARMLWEEWSPDWDFDDATFDRSAFALDNSDFIDVAIHSYRHRFGNADGDPRYAELEKRLAAMPPITVPAVTLDGDSDGVVAAGDGSASAAKFTARRIHRVVKGAGHNVPQEAPEVFAAAVLEVDRI
jgi:pimeloyl-ACP methyl ester carboxylesterase